MNSLRIIRRSELLQKTGLSYVQIWRLEKAGQFPRRVQLGPNSVGWLCGEVDQWITQKADAR